MDTDKKVAGKFNFKQIVRWIIVVAIFFFLGKMVWENWVQVKDAPFTLKPFPLILSTLVFTLSYFIQVWAWYLITLKLGIALSPSETLKNWFYSQLGKYLPGKVWLFLGRFYFYESKGKSKKAISIALYLEMATVIIAAVLISCAGFFLSREIRTFSTEGWVGWLILIFMLAFISIHPRVLKIVLNWILVLFKKDPITLSISYSDVLRVLSVCILAWLVGGVGLYLFVDSVIPVSIKHILFLTGALAFSSTLGMVALFAPSGLGVREGTLVYILSTIIPAPIAVVISILTRLWMTLIEIGLTGVIYLLDSMGKKERIERSI